MTWHSPTPRPRWAGVGEPVEVLSESPHADANSTCCWVQSRSELVPGALATRHGSPLRQNHGTAATTHYASRKELNRPPDQMTLGEQARRSLRDKSRCNKDFGASWTPAEGGSPPATALMISTAESGSRERQGGSVPVRRVEPDSRAGCARAVPASRPSATLQARFSLETTFDIDDAGYHSSAMPKSESMPVSRPMRGPAPQAR